MDGGFFKVDPPPRTGVDTGLRAIGRRRPFFFRFFSFNALYFCINIPLDEGIDDLCKGGRGVTGV